MVSVSLFPKQFTVRILNSFLRGVRLFPGCGVRLSRCPSSLVNLSPFICFPIWLMVSGSPDVSRFMCLPVAIHLSPSLAGGVRLSGCLSSLVLLRLPVWLVVSRCLPIHLSPSLAGGVRLSGCLSSLVNLSPFICFPVWLMVSGSSNVSQLIYFLVWLVVSGSLDVCFHLFPFILSPSLAGSVRLSGCLSSLVFQFICLPVWLVVSGSLDVFSLLSRVSHHVSLATCLPVLLHVS